MVLEPIPFHLLKALTPPSSISLTTAGATNFENLTGTTSAETLNGDANANILIGNGGADTLNGNGGNDTLYADSNHSLAINNGASNTDSDDILVWRVLVTDTLICFSW